MINPDISKPRFDVGALIVESLSRFGGWALAGFMRAPMQNTALGLVASTMVFSATNALYWQPGAHPAPLFGEERQVMNIQDTPIVDPQLEPPHPLELAVSRAERNVTASAPPVPRTQVPAQNVVAPDGAGVTNEALAGAQQILKSLGFFSGKVDGFYGPQTAQAIRAFETSVGLPPKGAMSPDVILRILNGPHDPVGRTAPATSETAAVSLAPQTAPPAPSPAPVAHASAEQSSAMPAPLSAPAVSTQDILADISNAAAQRSTSQSSTSQPPMPPIQPATQNPVVDRVLVEKIQRALASLGFYNQTIDGIAGESTAKAIREFENFKSFDLTGRITPELLDWLESAGAQI